MTSGALALRSEEFLEKVNNCVELNDKVLLTTIQLALTFVCFALRRFDEVRKNG